jgi:hypothetical protein
MVGCVDLYQGGGPKEKQTGYVLVMRQGEGMEIQRDKT